MEILNRTGLAGAAVAGLREEILEGRLVQGQRLSEVNLSSSLGVSRAPIREALFHLEQEGLVVSLPYKGASVVTLSPQDFLELSTLRTSLEKLAWARALERRTQADVRAMKVIIDEMRHAVENGHQEKLVRLDLDFHEHVFLVADHSRLHAAWQAIKWQVALYLLTRRIQVDDYHSIIVPEHTELLELLSSGEAEALDATIDLHIRSAYERLSTRQVNSSVITTSTPAPSSPSNTGG
ncbi:GntR family transcriptional regulator [Salinibacterium sp. SWN1162]|uniref:GntR family transcriptional regulator n=1 Tax=Salinibacterium sp. SWN1162 TaxID=2792053 RepID=UPI0018CCFEAF|nr:GntR family transcriptional regulator [Salinibacterium sp. SWN1162]MBH0008680.1 GntR family transcriptional regulator [Salinibacterium sp. SWN1162]